MYDYLLEGNDLYSESFKTYVFYDRTDGAISWHTIKKAEADELARKSKDKHGKQCERWKLFIGVGPCVEFCLAMKDNFLEPSYDFCKRHYDQGDWIDTKYYMTPVKKATINKDFSRAKYSIGISYSWGEKKEPIICALEEDPWEKAKELAVKECVTDALESGSENGISFDTVQKIASVHYTRDNTYCYFKMQSL